MASSKAILFDLDGTLRDTREVIYPAIEHALLKHTGTKPTREQMKKFIHHHSEIHKAFAPGVSHDDFVSTYKEHVEILRSNTVVYEGVDKLLASLKRKGYKLGIVSSAFSASDYLQSIKALHYFDVIISGPDTILHKPHPEPVLLALQRLGVSANKAIFIGDLPVDIAAATGAHIKATIGVTHGFGTKQDLQASGCAIIVDSLLEVEEAIKKIDHDA